MSLNLPPQLLQDLQDVPGFDRASFLSAHEQDAVVSLRLHPEKGGALYAGFPGVPWCIKGRYLPQRPVFTLDPLLHAGAYYVQEASSMFLDYMVRQLYPQRSGLRVLDLCAAPGGKSTLLASLLDEDSLLLCNEVIRSRASILEENMIKWGGANTWVCSNDPRDIGRLEGYFDLVVVDAPCSGSGLFRKDAAALDEWSADNVTLCSQRQQRILADIWPALKEDGVLVYATCSYSPQEDEAILQWLQTEYEVEGLSVPVPEEWGIVTTVAASLTGYRFFPGKVQGEGFFIAAIRKKGPSGSLRLPRSRSAHDAKAAVQARPWLREGDRYHIVPVQKDLYSALLPVHEPDWQLLQKAVYLRRTGLPLGQPTAKEWLPAHDLALSAARNEALPAVPLDREQALRYLKKEDFALPDIGKGWYLVTYEGRGLGWIKALGNRFNNYLPKHWRIRMDIDGEIWA